MNMIKKTFVLLLTLCAVFAIAAFPAAADDVIINPELIFTPQTTFSVLVDGTASGALGGVYPYGETATYGEIARRLEKRLGVRRMSAQAVGNAVGRNPVALMIPCHRVMGAHGNLTGYGYGADRKLLLLRLEGVATEGFYLPGLSAPELEKALRQAQIKRIAAYEDLMRETTALLQNAPNDARLREGMRALEIYYGSAVWKQDFADDEAGLLPSHLKRGVLSEDGLYDLLEEYGQLLREKQ